MKQIKNNLKEQKFDLLDGSTLTTKIRPKWDPRKTKITIEWNKKFSEDDVELYARINAQVVKCFEEGVGYNKDSDHLQVELGATKKW